MPRCPVILATLALTACQAGEEPSTADRYADAFDSLANAVCECDFRGLAMPETSITAHVASYDSQEACRADLPTDPDERACLSELAAAETALDAALECRREMFTAIADCLESSTCGAQGQCYSAAPSFGCAPLANDLEERLTSCLH